MTSPYKEAPHRSAWRRAGAALPIALLTACAVGPDYHRLQTATGERYAPGEIPTTTSAPSGLDGGPQHFLMGRDIPYAWWNQFQSPQLDKLVEKAIKANPTIPAAQAALRQAMELVYAQQGYFYPSIGADFNAERQKLAGNVGGNSPGVQGNGSVISTYQNPGGPAPYNGPVLYNFYTSQLVLGWTPDVFGSNRRQVESLQAQADNLRYQMEATYITLASNVASAGVQIASLRAQIAATRAYIDANAKSLDILHDQFRLGYVMRIDVALQESALAQAKAQLPPLEKQLEQTRDLLRALCGSVPSEAIDDDLDLAALHLPQDLPVSLPSALIEQRPDVRAAEEQMHAASAQVGVAIAARLPQFTINGAIGGTASRISQMYKTGGPFWNIIGDIAQPIFDGGTLLHRQRAAEQGLIQAQEQYRSTVLSALQNVADTLHAIASDADALVAAVDAEHAAAEVLTVTQKQYDVGYVNLLVLLAARAAHEQAQVALLQARTNRFADSAALFQALGGGWWNRPTGEAVAQAAK